LGILCTISEQIKDLDISTENRALTYLEKTCQQNDNTSSLIDEEATTSISDQEEVVSTISKTLKDEEEPLALNKINSQRNTRTRNYYPRPTLLDI